MNLKNKDEKCALWCIVRHLNPKKKDPQRITLDDREFAKRFNVKNITFPTSIRDIKKLEDIAKVNINLFDYDRTVFPLYISEKDYSDTVNMLRISNEDKSHFVYIKNFNKLMCNKTKHHGKKYFCMRCMHPFCSERSLAMHKERCYAITDCVAIKLPRPHKDKNTGKMKKTTIFFKKFNRGLPVPFTIYADFEAIIEKIHSVTQTDDKSYTEKNKKHTPCSYSYKLICCYDNKFSKNIVNTEEKIA